jgi:hypothetical protein
VFSILIPGIGALDPYLGVFISGVIAAGVTAVFYRLALKNADELMKKAST